MECPAAQDDPQDKATLSNCSKLKQTQQTCAHFLGALGPNLSLPDFMTRHVINESVSITTFPLPLHYSHVYEASDSHTVFGRIAVAPLLTTPWTYKITSSAKWHDNATLKFPIVKTRCVAGLDPGSVSSSDSEFHELCCSSSSEILVPLLLAMYSCEGGHAAVQEQTLAMDESFNGTTPAISNFLFSPYRRVHLCPPHLPLSPIHCQQTAPLSAP